MLTADDRALLREVFRAAHAKGWTRCHDDADCAEPGSRYWVNDTNTHIELDRNGWVKTPISEVENVTVQLTVDVLVAVGVLPARLSSAFSGGMDAVLSSLRKQFAPGFKSDGMVITAQTYTEEGARQSVEDMNRRSHGDEVLLFGRLVSKWQPVEASEVAR